MASRRCPCWNSPRAAPALRPISCDQRAGGVARGPAPRRSAAVTTAMSGVRGARLGRELNLALRLFELFELQRAPGPLEAAFAPSRLLALGRRQRPAAAGSRNCRASGCCGWTMTACSTSASAASRRPFVRASAASASRLRTLSSRACCSRDGLAGAVDQRLHRRRRHLPQHVLEAGERARRRRSPASALPPSARCRRLAVRGDPLLPARDERTDPPSDLLDVTAKPLLRIEAPRPRPSAAAETLAPISAIASARVELRRHAQRVARFHVLRLRESAAIQRDARPARRAPASRPRSGGASAPARRRAPGSSGIAAAGSLASALNTMRASAAGASFGIDRRRLFRHDLVQHRGQIRRDERLPPGQHQIQHRADREDVGALVDRRCRAPARATCSRACRR